MVFCEWEDCEREDRQLCLMSSIMHTLSMISRASPVCRRSALFAMLQKQKECSFPIMSVQKVSIVAM